MSEVYAVILAGGSGSRLWPLSRQQLPKQFLSLEGNDSLLQTTINRLSPTVEAEHILIVTQETHAKGEAYIPIGAKHRPENLGERAAAHRGDSGGRISGRGRYPALRRQLRQATVAQ
jgi:NDP-sugar pyrophosphorylase family protein